jgi:7-cyano-7-deazaguanine synthase
MKKAIVLLSGGLDSATTLYYVKNRGYTSHCLIFGYGQRHSKEIKQAIKIAKHAKVPYQVLNINLPWQGSALLNKKAKLPHRKVFKQNDIPVTYVPARNIIFLSFAVSFAEAIGAEAVFIGANAIDYSGYPDCRPKFFEAFSKVARQGLKSGVQGKAIKIVTPLVHLTKAQIIKLGLKLGVPFELTWSCYAGGRRPCLRCESCQLRERGFSQLGIKDPS